MARGGVDCWRWSLNQQVQFQQLCLQQLSCMAFSEAHRLSDRATKTVCHLTTWLRGTTRYDDDGKTRTGLLRQHSLKVQHQNVCFQLPDYA